jgi:hypothetical protein
MPEDRLTSDLAMEVLEAFTDMRVSILNAVIFS